MGVCNVVKGFLVGVVIVFCFCVCVLISFWRLCS